VRFRCDQHIYSIYCIQRLWQMEFQRRLASGRLAEVLIHTHNHTPTHTPTHTTYTQVAGSAATDFDKLMRTFGRVCLKER